MGNHTINETAPPPTPTTPVDIPLGDIPTSILNFATLLLVILLAYAVGRLGRFLYFRIARQKPTSANLFLSKLLTAVIIAIAFSMALKNIYEIQAGNLITAFGVLGIVLGFGLQNTVANFAAGLTLSADKAFDVGDRVKIGETWGDVTSIGLRSTVIQTTSGESVIVPNSLMDTQEVWNMTHQDKSIIRVSLPIGISYDSSIELAEDICLRAARRCTHVVAYPEPNVKVEEFAENSVNLELRVWITSAELRPLVRDQVLRDIKNEFDEEGVQFPFPQRTLSYAKEIPPAAPTPEYLKDRKNKDPVVIILARTAQEAIKNAPIMLDFVRQLEARPVIVHIRPEQQRINSYEAERSISQYLSHAHRRNLRAKTRNEVGDLYKLLPEIAREEGAKIILIPDNQTSRISIMTRIDHKTLKARCEAPIVKINTDKPANKKQSDHWKKVIEPTPEEQETGDD